MQAENEAVGLELHKQLEAAGSMLLTVLESDFQPNTPMAAAAPVTARDRRRRTRAPMVPATVAYEDGEEQHLNPFLDAAPSGSLRVQFRNVASRARWVEEAGAAEVVEGKGKLWLTTGVTRGGKLYYNVEEIGFFTERGALILLGAGDETIGMKDVYEKIAGGNYGCSWDAFQAYKHLKSLGYIVGRYGVPWTNRHSGTCDTVDPSTSVVDTAESFSSGTRNDIINCFSKLHIDGMSPSFQVYLPNRINHPQGLNWKLWKTSLRAFLLNIAVLTMEGSAFSRSIKLHYHAYPDG